MHVGQLDLFVGEVADTAEQFGADDGAGGELQGFKLLESVLQVAPANDDSMVVHEDAVVPGAEG